MHRVDPKGVPRERALRQLFLWLFVAFLAATALLAIVTVLAGNFGETEGRILASSSTVSAACVCAMACAAFRERERCRQLGSLGIGLAIAAAVASLLLIWGGHASDAQARVTLLLVLYAVGVAHAEVLLLPALLPAHRWVQRWAVGAIGALVLLLTWFILGDRPGDDAVRVAIVLSIVVALLTLVVPILWKIGRAAAAAAPGTGRVLVLHQQADGTWADGDGVRWDVRRPDDGERGSGPVA